MLWSVTKERTSSCLIWLMEPLQHLTSISREGRELECTSCSGSSQGPLAGGGCLGGKETCLTVPFTIPIFSWALGYNCLSLNYLYFNFRGSLMREEGESGARSAISSHLSFLSFAQHRGWVCSFPHVENMHWFLEAREATGGSRLGGGPVVEETAAARAKFSL